jgi:hypothetical protein
MFMRADSSYAPASSLTTTEALEAYERGWLAVSDVADLSRESRAAVGARFVARSGFDFVRVGKVLRAVRRGATVNAEIREVA